MAVVVRGARVGVARLAPVSDETITVVDLHTPSFGWVAVDVKSDVFQGVATPGVPHILLRQNNLAKASHIWPGRRGNLAIHKIIGGFQHHGINEGKVRFEHHAFPLDLAALNAEIVVRCHVDSITKIKLLGKMYEKQKIWAVGSDINKINESIKKIGLEHNLDSVKMDECLKSEEAQDNVLNQRIEAQKKYKIDSTPTILINEKKYDGKIDYKQFKKAIEKNL